MANIKKEKIDPIMDNMKLLGLKMPYGDEFCSYFESLPPSFEKCIDFRDFYRIKKGKRNYIKENLEPNFEMEYIVYSPTSKMYYYKKVQEYNDMNTIFNYFKDGNLYILKDQLRIIPEQPEVKQSMVNEEEDYILF